MQKRKKRLTNNQQAQGCRLQPADLAVTFCAQHLARLYLGA